MIPAGMGLLAVSEEEVFSLTGAIRETFPEVKTLGLDIER